MIYNSGKNLPKKGNVAFIAGSGGAGTITADLTSKYGLNLPEFNTTIYQELLDIFPDWMPPNKFAFVDIWPAMEKAMMNRIHPDETLDRVYRLLINEPEIEGIFTMRFCSSKFRTMGNIDKNIDSLKKSNKPTFFWLIGDAKEVADISVQLANNNIPNFNSLEDMVKNFKILVQESNSKKK
jgi:acyl-CoA synthetase (NDP forming)